MALFAAVLDRNGHQKLFFWLFFLSVWPASVRSASRSFGQDFKIFQVTLLSKKHLAFSAQYGTGRGRTKGLIASS